MKMYRIIFIAVLLSAALTDAAAQVKARSTDVFEELDSGSLTLRFFHALTGQPVPGGTVVIQGAGTFVTDEEGKVIFPPPEEDGVLLVRFTADGFVPAEFPVEVMAGTLFFNRMSVSPLLNVKHLRVTVDWDREPADLDAHFMKQGEYHLSFRHMRVLADGTGQLDIDAMKGYGPETVTVQNVSPDGEYTYEVHDYSNRTVKGSKALSRSKATVKVYGEGRLLHVFQVPRDASGTVWRVFSIVRGQIRELRQLGE